MPYASAVRRNATTEEKGRFQQLLARARSGIPTRFRAIVARNAEERIFEPDWRSPAKDGSQGIPEGDLLRAGVSRPSVREANWPPAEKWSPKIVPFMKSMTLFHERRLEGEERTELAEAIEHLDRALAIFPDHPIALYESAALRYLHGGDDEEAARRFRSAARYDRAPRKANDAINQIVREVAREFAADPLVRLYDAEAEFSSRVPLGLIGWEWMTDDCHLHEGVRRELMRSFARAILEPWG
jgi:tetratricopeptide (TPR) repeat protein